MDRAALIDRLWEESPLFLSRAEFARTLQGWEVHAVDGPSGLGAIVITKGPEFHFQPCATDFQVTRDHLRRWPGELIARYGYALTRTPKDDARQCRFNARLGFKVVGEDGEFYEMRIERQRVKEPSCQLSQ